MPREMGDRKGQCCQFSAIVLLEMMGQTDNSLKWTIAVAAAGMIGRAM